MGQEKPKSKKGEPMIPKYCSRCQEMSEEDICVFCGDELSEPNEEGVEDR
jgi:hypothetical protein